MVYFPLPTLSSAKTRRGFLWGFLGLPHVGNLRPLFIASLILHDAVLTRLMGPPDVGKLCDSARAVLHSVDSAGLSLSHPRVSPPQSTIQARLWTDNGLHLCAVLMTFDHIICKSLGTCLSPEMPRTTSGWAAELLGGLERKTPVKQVAWAPVAVVINMLLCPCGASSWA